MKKALISLFFISTCFWASFVFAAETVNINTATLSQLDTLAGIGPVYAQRIINNRPFSSIDDLDRVKGIGPTTLQKIKIQGLACVNCSSTQPVIQPAAPSNDGANPTSPAPTPTVIYPSGVVINEILPNPAGADETMEWIELYNSNNFDVDLSGWQLQDKAGTTTTYTIPSVTKILADNFLVFKRPDTKIMLNNDKDGINLLTPDAKIIDSVTFTSAPLGQSYNKNIGLWQWNTTLTPGAANIIATPLVKTTAKTLPKTQKSDNNSNINSKDLTASLSQTMSTQQSPWPLFFTVLAVTIILALSVLFIKLKFLK